MNDSRNSYFDFLRGIAIIMVVGIHTFSRSNGGFDSLVGTCNVIGRQILNCAVPLFLAISGFFLGYKDLSDKEKRLAFWKHQIPKVYLPALIWGFPWFVLSMLEGENIVLSIVFWLIGGLSIFYYISLTIQYYLLLPYIQKAPPLRCVMAAAVISIVSISFVTHIRAFECIELPLIIYAGPFPVWLIFFVLGVTLQKSKRDYSLVWVVIAIIASLLLQIIETHYLIKIGAQGYGIKISSFLFSAFIIILFFSNRIERVFNQNSILNKMIVYIGSISFGIYLSHMLVYRVLKYWSFFDGWHGWYIRWIIVLSADILVVVILKRILPEKVSRICGL